MCFVVPAAFISTRLKGNIEKTAEAAVPAEGESSPREKLLVFWLGISCLLFVPVFKTVTHLPPFMGMMLALGIMWLVTELMHYSKDEAERGPLSVNHALRKIDTPSVLFFLGILLSVAALQTTGMLGGLAAWIGDTVGNLKLVTVLIGLLSSVVDNVPMVAAAQGMYSIQEFPTDHYFWEFLAYSAGTGGSCLVIGSAAGVAAMGLEKIKFFWYLKNIAWLALLGFLSGAAVYLFQLWLLG